MPPSHALYITGFEPFGTHAYNPSAHLAEHLARQLRAMGVHRCHQEVLPVTFACAERYAVERNVPADAVVIHIGLAAHRTHISLEQIGRNHHGATPDNDGKVPSQQGILKEGGVEQLGSTLDLEVLEKAIAQADQKGELPEVRITQDAGSYVCNAIYYHTLHRARRSLFLHIPNWSEAQVEHFAPLISKGLTTIL